MMKAKAKVPWDKGERGLRGFGRERFGHHRQQLEAFWIWVLFFWGIGREGVLFSLEKEP
jgi:hypothetical protein